MAQFLKQFLLFITLIATVLCGLELPIQLNYETRISNHSDWHSLENINAEILVIGNSRVWTGFDASKIQEVTGKSTYILAQDGWQIDLLRAKFRHYLKSNSKPQILIIQADQAFLGKRRDWYGKSDFLKYIFMDREDLMSQMRTYDGYIWYEVWIPFVRYAGVPGRYVRDAFALPFSVNRVQGFRARPATNKPLETIPFDSLTIKEEFVQELDMIFSQSPESERIIVFPLVSSSLYPKIKGEQHIREYSDARGIDYLNLNTSYPNPPDSIFDNHTHVNIYGATVQTLQLIELLNALQLP